MLNDLHIALAQLNPIVGDLAGNSALILEAWQQAEDDGDALVVFSELMLSGYPPEDLILKPSFIDAVHDAIEDLAKQSADFGCAALIGTPWRMNGDTYNAALLIHGGAVQAVTLKHHLPNYGVFDEKRVFSAGDLPLPIDFNGIKLGVLICEDFWFPDTAAHLKAEGAEILITLNASPFAHNKKEERLTHAQARVAETGLPFISVNQVGGQDELVFDGGSFALDANGELIAQAPQFESGLYDTTEVAPLLPDLEAIYEALCMGVRDYVQKNGFPGVLLGMSGGIDSALSAAIAADALGSENVRSVMMPTDFTSQDSLDDAKACAELLGISYEILSIQDSVDIINPIVATSSSAFPANAGTFEPQSNRSLLSQGRQEEVKYEGIAFENIQSRIRGLILMALSNQSGYMMLSTGNKSEMAVGYATLYGDMNGGYNALKDVYKTQVYALAHWRNERSPVIPERIITKAPTAELRDNQTDQDSLPDYEVLDTILHGLIEEELSVTEIVAQHGYDRAEVERVWRMLDRAEYKRRQAPPGVKITTRAFGRERRYPLTNKFGTNRFGK